MVYTGFTEPLEQVSEVPNGKSLHREYSCSSAFAAVLLLTLQGTHGPLLGQRQHAKAGQAPASSARLYKKLGYVKQALALRDEFASLSLEQLFCFLVTIDPLQKDCIDRDYSLLATWGASTSSNSVQCQVPQTNGDPSC